MNSLLQEHFHNAKVLIEQSHRILLTMHERMDGDDGGALLAVRSQLEGLGKQPTCAIKKGVPPQLTFLPGSEHIQDDVEHTDFDLLITFGCATKDRTGSDMILATSCPVINFDHHPDNAFFGDVNVVDKNKSSVAELIYDFFMHCGWNITYEVATCLLTGVITDTGSFMHSNTQESTLKAAAELLKRGAQTSKIIKHTWKNKNPHVLKAWGRAMDNSFYDPNKKIIYAVLTQEDLEELGHLPQAAFEGFVETLNTVPEAKFAMFLRQEGDVIKGSLRSDQFKNVDVSRIAQMFGGGGHKQAAGFSFPGKLVKEKDGTFRVS